MAPYVFRLPLGVQYDNLNKPGYNYLDPKWSWYQVPIQTGRSTWSPLYFDERGGGDYMITYSVPARRSGRVSAVCTVDVGWPQLIAGIQRLRYHGGQVSADEASFLLYSPTSAEAPIASPIPLLQAPGPQSQTDGDLIRNALSNNIPVLNAIQTPPFGQTSVTVPNGRLVKILFARIPSMNATLLYTRILSSSDGLREHIGAASAIGGVLFGVLAAVVILLSLRNHSGHLPPN
jgi:hypothetical protein